MISLIFTIKNRANLLKWGLEGVFRLKNSSLITEINVVDGGSTDNLDEVLKKYSNRCIINKYFFDRKDSFYNHVFNCPALEYDFLVKKSDNETIIKIDPEFAFITDGFIDFSLSKFQENVDSFVIPFPYHTDEFDIEVYSDIVKKYQSHRYHTHLNEEGVRAGSCRLVYYGAMFKKKSFIDLGGVDVRFVEGIGAEDDHFLDQWQRKYGKHSVISTVEQSGVHLWHGNWGKSVPTEYSDYVYKNQSLRNKLSNTFPNDGNFDSIKFPLNYTHVII